MSLPPFVCYASSPRQSALTVARILMMLCLLGESGWSQQKSREGVAVLDDGRVFQGTVEEVPGGYRVQYPGGSSILPFDRISVTSASLVGAYEAFRDSIQTPNADAHLKLAEWCLLNGLYAQADIEVQSALRLEPMRSDAKLLLQQVDAILRPGMSTATASTAQPVTAPAAAPRAAISAASFTGADERRVSGLSRQTQLDYMRKIQPLLMNKCGNAGCHGPDVENQLKLRNARPDSHGLRLASEHNQTVLFQFIDYERPDRSPLLQKSREDSPVHKNLFAASWQQSQLALLEQWVTQVARERKPDVAAAARPLRKGEAPQRMTLIQSESTIQQVSGTLPEATILQPPGQLPPTVSGQSVSTSSTDANGASSPTGQEFLESIRQSHRPDAFDPEAFNRQMHSGGLSR